MRTVLGVPFLVLQLGMVIYAQFTPRRYATFSRSSGHRDWRFWRRDCSGRNAVMSFADEFSLGASNGSVCRLWRK